MSKSTDASARAHIALVDDDYASRDREKEKKEERRERGEGEKESEKDDEGCLFCSEKSAMKVIHLDVRERERERKDPSPSLCSVTNKWNLLQFNGLKVFSRKKEIRTFPFGLDIDLR